MKTTMRTVLGLLLPLAITVVFWGCASICHRTPKEGTNLPFKPNVKLGIDVLLEKQLDLIKGKRVGLVTNPTGVDGQLRASADLLAAHPDIKLVALFGPEHGIRGGVGGRIEDTTDPKTGVPIFSLYGRTDRPTPEMLENVDVLLFDIQDIGSRSYTYISTMYKCMEAVAKQKVKFIVLDRPNPVNGIIVSGNVLDPKFKSGIGIAPIAYMHGMTVGELALFFNNEYGLNCDLEVVKMEGWKRNMTWRDTGLVWTPTSPHIPEADSSWFYPITGIFGETPLVNIGVGYTLPFKIVGAPWMDAEEVASALNAKNLPGVFFQPFYFKPFYMHYKDEFCKGFRIIITDECTIQPVEVGYYIIEILMKMYPNEFNFESEKTRNRIRMFDLANGTDQIRLMFQQGIPAEKIIGTYQADVENFKKKREKYLLYR
jgi:uncharacterized protein YbbC (DUF1343 family)